MVIAVRSLITRILPGAAHIEQVDPRIQLNLVPAMGKKAPDLKHVMSNSFAFGGTHAVLFASAIHPNEAGVPGQS